MGHSYQAHAWQRLKPARLESGLCKRRGDRDETPLRHKKGDALLTETRERLCAATETQSSHTEK